MRKKIYDIIEVASYSNYGYRKASTAYDAFMIITIILSLVPLAVKEDGPFLLFIDRFTFVVFAIDYILRLCTADYKYNTKSLTAFIRYPFSLMAIVDLLSILPSILLMYQGLKVMRVARLLRAMRVFRMFKAFRYSRHINLVVHVFKSQKQALISVLFIFTVYVVLVALLGFHSEPDQFDTFLDAIYWSVVSITTIGYGDIVLVTPLGKILTMISAVMGVAIIAIPSGIITAGYVEEMEKRNAIRHYDQLKEYRRLMKEGLITQEDYDRKKEELLFNGTDQK